MPVPSSLLSSLLVAGGLLTLLDAAPASDAESGATIVKQEEAWRKATFNELADGVVFISSKGGFGSGFFVSTDGLILTNAHVVGKSSQVTVILRNGKKVQGDVVDRAPQGIDIALVQVPLTKTKALPLGLSSALSVGAWVGTVGHGSGAIWTFNIGMVSNIYSDGAQRPVFQTQIPVNPGNSGGPVFDRRGRVVGIMTAGLTDANSINFAIKIDKAMQHLERIAARCECITVTAPQNTAVYVDGVLVGSGKTIVPVTTGTYEISAVIRGKLIRRRVEFPRQRSVNLEKAK